jgi:hypothetical protein
MEMYARTVYLIVLVMQALWRPLTRTDAVG